MNKKLIFSGFNNGYSNERNWTASLDVLVQKIKSSEKLKKDTEELRDVYTKLQTAKVKMDELKDRPDDDPEKIEAEKEVKRLNKLYTDLKKKNLPLVTVHADFEKGRKDGDPHTYNDLILTDIDHISGEQIDDLMPSIKKQPYVVLACRSVSGEGLHILTNVEVEGGITDENFKDVFQATTQLVEYDLNIVADKHVNTISRCMFLNYDDEVYYNPDATSLDINTALWLETNILKNL